MRESNSGSLFDGWKTLTREMNIPHKFGSSTGHCHGQGWHWGCHRGSEAGLRTAKSAHALLLSLLRVLQGCSVLEEGWPHWALGFGAGLAGMFWGVLGRSAGVCPQTPRHVALPTRIP